MFARRPSCRANGLAARDHDLAPNQHPVDEIDAEAVDDQPMLRNLPDHDIRAVAGFEEAKGLPGAVTVSHT